MNPKSHRKHWILAGTLLAALFGYAFMVSRDRVDFNTEVKPLLNRKCISCHGGVRKKSDYSLLFRQEALDTGASGRPGIVPGAPDASELIRRLDLHDPEERMPYREPPLSDEEKNTLRRWISEGAEWGDHWAYQTVTEVDIPGNRRYLGLLPSAYRSWIRNDIDRFILHEQQARGLEPSNEADRRTLARRASLDLIGMPAPESIVNAFLEDPSEDAYGHFIDTLLSMPQYGERWTAPWLDLARYADTKGYERDDNRSIWRYRDWLIRAFNEDKPYDAFLTEQIAGDLLPQANDEQLIATAFHRNTMTNDEGGTDNEEFRTAAVIDRVNTTWETLLGTSFACVQCHSHPYDPFRQEEYYRFMAFFNDSRDEDTYSEYPLLHEYRGEDKQRLDSLDGWLTAHATPRQRQDILRFLKTRHPAHNSIMADSLMNSALSDTKWLVMRKQSGSRFRRIDLTGKDVLLIRYTSGLDDGKLTVSIDRPDGPRIAEARIPKSTNGWEHLEIPLSRTSGVHDLHFGYTSPSLKTMEENGIRFDWLHFTGAFPGMGTAGHDTAHRQFLRLLKPAQVTLTPIMLENTADMHRPTHVFEKGNRLLTGPMVEPGVPGSLNPFPENAPKNRLGLAKWLTDTRNPLTARTMVNRLWEQLFGLGLVETLEDLGTQGIPPTHRELLDHLSWRFMHDFRWSIKRLLKEIVLSATYRQNSDLSEDALKKDPFNRWLTRGPRVRLSAEQIRDQALHVGGLLSSKMYGPSVMPYQPDGIWLSPYNGQRWEKSKGEDQHRRAIYTFLKRTGPYPSLMSFDGSAREVCLSRRIRTNTPLQALTTLNDPAFLESARNLAIRLFREMKGNGPAVIDRAYLKAIGRPIGPAKRAVLVNLYHSTLDRMRKDPAKTCALVGIEDENNRPEVAALVVVNNAILNLDEFLTKN